MIPAYGFHPGVPAAEYFGWPLASASRLKLLARSPAHCKFAIDHPDDKQTKALRIGSALHCNVLEPDQFDERYVVAGNCMATKGTGGVCGNPGKVLLADGQWLCGVHARGKVSVADREVLTFEEYATVIGMGDSVLSHPAARRLVETSGAHEMSVLLRSGTEISAAWECPRTGQGCKLRTDMLCDLEGEPVVCDLKTTDDASPAEFEKAVWNFDYYVQAAHYLSGFAALGRPVEHFCFIAIEKSPPHGVAVYRLLDEVLAAGREEVYRLLETYRQCEESGDWPCYSASIQPLGVPQWALKQILQQA